jgi:hypothetical protein
MAVHQPNTHSRSRQHVPRLPIHLTSDERAALGRLQRRHHLKSKDDALRLAIYLLGSLTAAWCPHFSIVIA